MIAPTVYHPSRNPITVASTCIDSSSDALIVHAIHEQFFQESKILLNGTMIQSQANINMTVVQYHVMEPLSRAKVRV
jgi:archaellum component FlaF (FlaF/FlaG flagellin family)